MSGPVDVLAARVIGMTPGMSRVEVQLPRVGIPAWADLGCTVTIANPAAVAELIETQKDTLRMLEAAYRQLGIFAADNKRIQRAKNAIELVGGAA